MKVRSSLKLLHPEAKIVKRRGLLYVICKADPNAKMRMQGTAKKMK